MLYTETYAKDNDISFLIEDCGYSDLRALYIRRAANFNIPTLLRPVLIKYLSLVCRIRSGFFLEEVSPIKHINEITAPILFIHGDSDTENPTKMVYDLYNTKKTGVKALYIAKGANHAESLKVDKARYEEEVANFLNLVLKSDPAIGAD